MKKYYLFAGLGLMVASPAFAQVKIGAPSAPDPSAMLEVTSGPGTNKGLLLPKLTTVQRDAITLPATGLLIYNTTTNEVQANTGTPAAPVWSSNTAATAAWTTTGNAGTNAAANFIGTTDNQAMVIRTNNTEKVRVTNTGNVGIGSSAPGERLQVADTGNVAVQVVSLSGGTKMQFQLGNNNHGIIRNLTTSGGRGNDVALYTSSGLGAADSADIYLIANPTITGSDSLPLSQFVLKSKTGNVGIGTTDPTSRLNVNAGGVTVSSTAAIPSPAINIVNDGGGSIFNDDIAINSVGTTTAPSITMSTARGTVAAPANAQSLDAMGVFSAGARVNGTNLSLNTIQNTYLGNGTTAKSRMSFGVNNNPVSMTIDSSGYVGIGKPSPALKLDVMGGINLDRDVLRPSNQGASIVWSSLNYNGGATEFVNYHGTGTGGFRFYDVAPGVTPDSSMGELMRITGTGSVGIGTYLPAQKLDVVGGARISTAVGTPTTITGRNAAGDLGNVTLGSGLALTGGVLSATATPAASWNLAGNAGTNPAANFLGTTDAQPVIVRTNNTEKVRVTPTGYVGIGTTAPQAKLEAVDTGNVAVQVTSSTGGKMSFQLGNANHGIIRNLNSSGGNGNDVALFTSNGGTGADLYLITAPTAAGSDSLPLNQFVLKNGTGNVGIGTNLPAQKLHVANGGMMISNGSAPMTSPVISIVNDGAVNALNDDVNIYSYGAVTSPGFSVFTARGTAAAPANAQPGDNMGAYVAGTRINGGITPLNMISSSYVGNGITPKSRLNFATSGVNNTAMTIDSNGFIGMGVQSPRTRLDIAGGITLGSEAPPNTINATWIGWSAIRQGIGETEFVNYRGTGTGGYRFYSLPNSGTPGYSATPNAADNIAFIAAGTGAYAATSDARVKTNVNLINGGLKKVMAMHPVSYDFHTGRTLKNGVVSFTKDDNVVETIGFLAQELMNVVPEAVEVPKDTANELYAVSYSTLVPVLTKAIQEQQVMIDALKAELADVKIDNTALRADAANITALADRLKKLEAAIGASAPGVQTVSR